MTSRLNVSEMARDFAVSYRKSYPKANELTVQAETRNFIQELAKTQKISKKEIAKVQSVVSEVFLKMLMLQKLIVQFWCHQKQKKFWQNLMHRVLKNTIKNFRICQRLQEKDCMKEI